jgi:predicted subunit of tRNA(5-methylaminomethyl-2-thiouridylate) methyltransferase
MKLDPGKDSALKAHMLLTTGPSVRLVDFNFKTLPAVEHDITALL